MIRNRVLHYKRVPYESRGGRSIILGGYTVSNEAKQLFCVYSMRENPECTDTNSALRNILLRLRGTTIDFVKPTSGLAEKLWKATNKTGKMKLPFIGAYTHESWGVSVEFHCTEPRPQELIQLLDSKGYQILVPCNMPEVMRVTITCENKSAYMK